MTPTLRDLAQRRARRARRRSWRPRARRRTHGAARATRAWPSVPGRPRAPAAAPSSIGLLTLRPPPRRTSAAPGSASAPAATVLRANCRKASACGSWTLRSRTRLQRQAFGHDLLGQRHAPRPPGRLRSTRRAARVPLNCAAGTGLAGDDHVQRALQSDQRAAGAGCRRRPGSRPSLTSGSAERGIGLRDAVVRAQRQLQPATHADAGDRRDDRLRASPPGRRSAQADAARAPAAGVPNSLTSAPPENALLVPVMTMAWTPPSASARSSAANSSQRKRGTEAVDGWEVEGDHGNSAANLVAVGHGRVP